MREPARRYRGGALVLVLAGALLLAVVQWWRFELVRNRFDGVDVDVERGDWIE